MSDALALDLPAIAIKTREDLLLFASKIQIQQIDTPPGFDAACVADIVRVWDSGNVRTVPAGRATLADTLPPERDALLRDIFKRSLHHYLKTFYAPQIVEQCDFQLDVWAVPRYDGRPLAPHNHAESFVAMVYYPEAIDCSNPSSLFGGAHKQYYENQIVLCPPAPPRLEEKFSLHPAMNVGLSPDRGFMIIVPGPVPHFVTPADRKQRRVSIIGLVSTTPKTASRIEFDPAQKATCVSTVQPPTFPPKT